MLGSPVTGNAKSCQPAASIQKLTPLTEYQGASILQSPSPIILIQPSPPSAPHPQDQTQLQLQRQQRSKLLPIRPAPSVSPAGLTPIIVTLPVNISSSKRRKPTVRDMLKTRKKIQMIEKQQRQQRQIPAYQIIQHQVPPKAQGQHSIRNSAPSGTVKNGKKKGRPTSSTNTMDKKEIHRVNERHRHQNMNQAIRQLVSVLPKNSAPETETKQFVLQKANDYLTFLRKKIDRACDEMAIVQENQEGGLMSFDIPFESTAGVNDVFVPASKPITHSDLQHLLGPTSALKLTDPTPRRKTSPPAKPVPKAKPKHQPWFEINIKMSVSPYKKKSPKGHLASSSTSSKFTSSKGQASKKKMPKMKTCARKASTTGNRCDGITHDEDDRHAITFQSPSSVCSWASLGDNKEKSQVDSSRQSSVQSSNQSIKLSQSIKNESVSEDEVDQTCIDVLCSDDRADVEMQKAVRENNVMIYQVASSNPCSADGEDDVKFHQLASPNLHGFPLSVSGSPQIHPATRRDDTNFQQLASPEPHPVKLFISPGSFDDDFNKFHLSTDLSSPNVVTTDHTSEEYNGDGTPWFRYGLIPQSDLGLLDGQLQMDHSYSARALSPMTLKALQSSASKGILPDSTSKPSDDDGISRSNKGATSDSSSLGSPREVHQQNVDAILKTAILMKPPVHCIPPGSPVNDEGNANVIQVFGLDFEEDSESSGGSLSQNSPEMYNPGVVPVMAEGASSIATSLAPKQSSLRRSWINGYQLFTKINHARIKQSWPGLQGREITRLLGQSWKDLPNDNKKLYSIRACTWNQWYRKKRIQNKQMTH